MEEWKILFPFMRRVIKVKLVWYSKTLMVMPFNVQTLTDGGLKESRASYWLHLNVAGDCGLKFYVNLKKSPLSFAQFFSFLFKSRYRSALPILKSRQALPSSTKKTIQFWATNLCVTNQSVSVSVITRFSHHHDMNQIIEIFLRSETWKSKEIWYS